MTKFTIAAAACFISATAIPASADRVPMLKPGEAIAIMPDGNMARGMISDAKKLEMLMKVSKPIPWCKMLMAGPDGTVYLVNTDEHNPMVVCEEMVPGAQ
jgi:hypothetical protein